MNRFIDDIISMAIGFAFGLAAAAMFSSHACADPLTKTQNAFELAFTGELIADYKQSSQLGGACPHIENCKTYETNQLLGRSPSEDRLKLYFAGAAAMRAYSLDCAETPPVLSEEILEELDAAIAAKKEGV